MALGALSVLGGLVLLAFVLIEGGGRSAWGGIIGAIGGGASAIAVAIDGQRQEREAD